jgi:hypothetical protein
MGGLANGRVRRIGDDYLSLADLRLRRSGPFARRVDGEEDALGAAGGEDASRSFGRVQEALDGLQNLPLHALNAREDANAEAIFDHEHRVRGSEDGFELVAGVPDVGAVTAIAPVEVVAAHRLHLGGDGVPGASGFGQTSRHVACSSAAKRTRRSTRPPA